MSLFVHFLANVTSFLLDIRRKMEIFAKIVAENVFAQETRREPVTVKIIDSVI